MIEEELKGPVFRATLIGGKLVAVLRRDPPMVVGDGKRTVAELVFEENKNPLRRGPVFADISVDGEYATRELARQKLNKESVPEKGQIVQLHFKVNWGVGGTSRDATDEVHPDNIKLFEDVGRYLGDDIIGIDFMVSDIGRSWKGQERAGIIECNSLPHIGNHHFPFTGKVRNVAGVVWSAVFPE
jgi:cyanophycin synthetase